VEQAAAESIADAFAPATFLWIVFNRPNGSARVWYAWTAGGELLGDWIDTAAMNAGYDAADWLFITGCHASEHSRGRIKVMAHPLRSVLADVTVGIRAPGDERDKLLAMSALAAEWAGPTAPPAGVCPPWLGVGPALLGASR
jgi:hypothetical protein